MIETDDDACVIVQCHGYGRAYQPDGDRSSAPSCTSATATGTGGSTTSSGVCVGEVPSPSDPAGSSPDLVMDVAELIWEPMAE